MTASALPDEGLRETVAAIVVDCGCELWEMSLVGPRGNRKMRVYIDRLGGVAVENCAMVSQALSAQLPLAGINLDDVVLEVSSPGAERHLRGMEDYVRFVGDRVNLRYRSAESERVVEGTLSQVEEEILTVADAVGRLHPVPVADLVDARLAVEFGSQRRPRHS